MVFYDALIDPDLAIDVLHLVAPDIEVEVRRPIVLEHSNSSVVFDEAHILKVLRKVEPGPNPDVEIPRVLAERGYEHVLPPLRRAAPRRHGPRRRSATSSWGPPRAGSSPARRCATCWPRGSRPRRAAVTSRPTPPGSAATIAGLHVAMADAWGSEPGDPAQWVDQMAADLEEVAGAGRRRRARRRRGAGPARRRPRASRTPAAEIRVHGDLHLAQVIQVDAGWMVLDFEGEPARRRDDRFTPSSPLRDVAGMLRSLHYAAATGLAEWDQGDAELLGLLDAWEERNRDAFLDAYYGEEGIDALLPVDPAGRAALLAAFELDKAVYELGYELAHRPDLVSIPLAGIDRLVRRPRPHMTPLTEAPGLPTEFDLHLFGQGKHERLWDVLGAHVGGRRRTAFAVWAPHARKVVGGRRVQRLGPDAHPLERLDAGVWGGFVPGIGSRTPYKYAVTGADGRTIDRADPMAQFAEHSGGMASIVFESQHTSGRTASGWRAPRRRRPGRATA